MHSHQVPRRSFVILSVSPCLILIQMPMRKKTDENQKMGMEVMRMMKNNHVSFEVVAGMWLKDKGYGIRCWMNG
jgi:hypothetical protein